MAAEEPSREVALHPVHRDTPYFDRAKGQEQGPEFRIKMVKIRGSASITTPPATEAYVLYYGQVKLGAPPVEYGVLIDLEGKEKLLWVDSDADGNFAQETSYPIFKSDRTPGFNFYYSPVPLVFKTKYTVGDHAYQIPLQFDLSYLLVAQSGSEDHFDLKNRTWLIGVLEEKGEELRIALVDANDNGSYNDPDDLVYIDEDYDLHFSQSEGKTVKKSGTVKLKSGTCFKIDFQYCPEKLILKKG